MELRNLIDLGKKKFPWSLSNIFNRSKKLQFKQRVEYVIKEIEDFKVNKFLKNVTKLVWIYVINWIWMDWDSEQN